MKGASPAGRYPKPIYRWLVLISFVFAAVMSYTMVRTKSTHTILSISKSQGRLERVRSYQKELILEVERLKSNRRITGIARTQLELEPYTLDRTIYLERGKF